MNTFIQGVLTALIPSLFVSVKLSRYGATKDCIAVIREEQEEN